MCTGIYRMCIGSSSNEQWCIAPMLAVLLEFLEDAQLMKPQWRESVNHPNISIDKPGKEPLGLECRDYFMVLCRYQIALFKNKSTNLYLFADWLRTCG